MLEEEEDDSALSTARYPVMPSLVSLQLMRNRLHLAYLGRKLMKWSAIATGRELRRVAMRLNVVYQSYGEEMRNAYMLLARGRYYCPIMNKMVLENGHQSARVTVQTKHRPVVGCKLVAFEIIESGAEPYEHLGIEKGGQQILEAKVAWLELLRRLVAMSELRRSFISLEIAYLNATKKKNMLSKILIPKVGCTMSYIITEMEEQAREETFRLKRVKQYLARRNKKDTDEVTCTCILEEEDDKEETIKCVCSSQNLSKTMVIDIPKAQPCGVGDEKNDLEGILTQVDKYVKTLTKRVGQTKSTEKFIEEFNKFKGTINRYTTSVPPKPKGSTSSIASVCAPKETGDSDPCSCHIIRETASECPSSGVCPAQQQPRKAVSATQSRTELRLEEGRTKGSKELLCPICYKIIADQIAKAGSRTKASGPCKKRDKTPEGRKCKSCSAITKESEEKTNAPCQFCSQRNIGKEESPVKTENHKRCFEDKQRDKSPEKEVECTFCNKKSEKESAKTTKPPCQICSQRRIGEEASPVKSDYHKSCVEETQRETKNTKPPCQICSQRKIGKEASPVKSDYHKRSFEDKQREKSPEKELECTFCNKKSEKESAKNTKPPCQICSQRKIGEEASPVKSDYHKSCVEETQRETKNTKPPCQICSQRKIGKEASPVKSDYHKRSFEDKQREKSPEKEFECTFCNKKSEKESAKNTKPPCQICSQRKIGEEASPVQSDYHKRCFEETQREKSPEKNVVCSVCKKKSEKRERKQSPCKICGQKSSATDARWRDTFTSTTDLDVIPSKAVKKKRGMPIKIIAKSSSSRDSVSASSECLTCNYSSRTKSLYASDTSTSVCTRCREGDTKESDKRRVSEPNICPKCQAIRERKSKPDTGKCPYCEKKEEAANKQATNKPVCPKCLDSESTESSMSEYQGGVSLSPEKSKCMLCRNDAKDQVSNSSSSGITGSILEYLKSKFCNEKKDEDQQKCYPGCILCKRPINDSSDSMRTLKDMRSSYPSSTKSRGIETRGTPECRSCMPAADSNSSRSEFDEVCCSTQTSKSPVAKHSCKFDDNVTQIQDTIRCVGEARKSSASKCKNTREVGVVTKPADRYDVRPVHMLANAVMQIRCVCKPQNPSKVCYCVSEPVVNRKSGAVRRTRSYNL